MDDQDSSQDRNQALLDGHDELLAKLPIEYRDRLTAVFSALKTTDPSLIGPVMLAASIGALNETHPSL